MFSPEALVPTTQEQLATTSEALLSDLRGQLFNQQLLEMLYNAFAISGQSRESILKECSFVLNRHEMALAKLALDYIEENYRPTDLEIAAFKSLLYRNFFMTGKSAADLYAFSHTVCNKYLRAIALKAAKVISNAEQEGRTPIALTQVELTSFPEVFEEATGIYITGDPGSGKSSGTMWCLGCATHVLEPAEIIIFDTHWEPGKWEGMTVLYEPDLILAQMRLMLDGFDGDYKQSELQRCKLSLREQKKLPLRFWVIEEAGDLKLHGDRFAALTGDKRWKTLLGDFLIAFGSQGRKYEWLGWAINQASNTSAAGMDGVGDYLKAFHEIRLGRVALKWAKSVLGLDKTVVNFLARQAYPCLVGETPAIHPTHGSYTVRKKKQPPMPEVEYPVRQLPLTVKLAFPPDADGWVAGLIDKSAFSFFKDNPIEIIPVQNLEDTHAKDDELYELFLSIKSYRTASPPLTKTDICKNWGGRMETQLKRYDEALENYASLWIEDFIQDNQLTQRWQDIIELIFSATKHPKYKERYRWAKEILSRVLTANNLPIPWEISNPT